MSIPYIVGMAGKAGSGKDTAAEYISEALRARSRKTASFAFADPIRTMLLALGVPIAAMVERKKKELPMPEFGGASYRQMAQTLGTEWGRGCMGNSFWVSRMASRVEHEQQRAPLDFILITDVRFPNEADWIRSQGGVVVQVERPSAKPVRDHVSEVVALKSDHLLSNDADLQNLRSRCGQLSLILMAERSLEH